VAEGRYWTEDEARAYLPRLRRLLEVIRRASHLAVAARGNGHASMPGATPASAPAPAAADEPAAPAIDAEEALRELEDGGIVLRDPARGLIDFPARHPGGRDVLLCWQLGEDELAWWHLPEDGFAGRRPLPLPDVL
jgi:Uncharacterized conserved protein (DUF2203)